MKKDPEVFLLHIIESICLIEEYSYGMNESSFYKNRSVQDCVIRRLEIIGEAVKNLPVQFKTKHLDIPWKKIAGMRDILIHEYFDVDLSLTWVVVKQEIPMIKKKIEVMLLKSLEK